MASPESVSAASETSGYPTTAYDAKPKPAFYPPYVTGYAIDDVRFRPTGRRRASRGRAADTPQQPRRRAAVPGPSSSSSTAPPPPSGEYKLMRLYSKDLPYCVRCVVCEVLALGEYAAGGGQRQWREVAVWDEWHRPAGRGVHIGGVVYYLAHRCSEPFVFCFDLSTYQVRRIKLPETTRREWWHRPSPTVCELNHKMARRKEIVYAPTPLLLRGGRMLVKCAVDESLYYYGAGGGVWRRRRPHGPGGGGVQAARPPPMSLRRSAFSPCATS